MPKITRSTAPEWQVALVRVALLAFCVLITWVTHWFCSAVQYDEHARVARPLRCVSAALENATTIRTFFLDKLTLLGAKRANSYLYWDDGIDLTLLANAGQSATAIEAELDAIAVKCLSGRVQPRVVTHAGRGTSRTTYSMGPFHIRVCRSAAGSGGAEIVCPMLHPSAQKDDEVLPEAHVLPTTACSLSGVTTRCPNNVGQLLADEFGPTWDSAVILNFRN